MELSVKGTGCGKPFKLQGLDASLTIAAVKKKCAEECGLDANQQRLFFKGKLLKDDDSLEVCKIANKGTLFLVKGASQKKDESASAAAAQLKAEEKKEEPAVAVPCPGGCGFFGTAKTDGYCTKCYAAKQKKEGGPELDKAKSEKKESGDKAKETPEVSKEPADKTAETDNPAKRARQEQTDKTRCWTCQKKCGLTGFHCRCDYTFCAKHRYAEEHGCDFDHKTEGRKILEKNNPNISAKGGPGDLAS